MERVGYGENVEWENGGNGDRREVFDYGSNKETEEVDRSHMMRRTLVK